MAGKSSLGKGMGKRQTQWDGLFVSEHAWDSTNNAGSNPQPMLSADEKKAIFDMLLVAHKRKSTVFIQFWQDRHFHYQRCTIRELDWEQRILLYEEAFEGKQLAIDGITSIYMLD